MIGSPYDLKLSILNSISTSCTFILLRSRGDSLEVSSDEEYTSPSYGNRGGKRKCMSSSTYFKMFKKMD
jgi:hypothetical protein